MVDTVRGVEQLALALGSIGARLPHLVAEALYRDMVGVMFESQKIVPFDEGDLHDSGEVDRPTVDAGRVGVVLHYGSTTVDYALVQHEDLTLSHPNGGQSKFLEQPLHQWADDGPAAVLRRAIRGVR